MIFKMATTAAILNKKLICITLGLSPDDSNKACDGVISVNLPHWKSSDNGKRWQLTMETVLA